MPATCRRDILRNLDKAAVHLHEPSDILGAPGVEHICDRAGSRDRSERHRGARVGVIVVEKVFALSTVIFHVPLNPAGSFPVDCTSLPVE